MPPLLGNIIALSAVALLVYASARTLWGRHGSGGCSCGGCSGDCGSCGACSGDFGSGGVCSGNSGNRGSALESSGEEHISDSKVQQMQKYMERIKN